MRAGWILTRGSLSAIGPPSSSRSCGAGAGRDVSLMGGLLGATGRVTGRCLSTSMRVLVGGRACAGLASRLCPAATTALPLEGIRLEGILGEPFRVWSNGRRFSMGTGWSSMGGSLGATGGVPGRGLSISMRVLVGGRACAGLASRLCPAATTALPP